MVAFKVSVQRFLPFCPISEESKVQSICYHLSSAVQTTDQSCVVTCHCALTTESLCPVRCNLGHTQTKLTKYLNWNSRSENQSFLESSRDTDLESNWWTHLSMQSVSCDLVWVLHQYAYIMLNKQHGVSIARSYCTAHVYLKCMDFPGIEFTS